VGATDRSSVWAIRIVLLVSGLASYIPARRAASADPAEVLRAE
jgi:ABC-type lipoprotein release transport system permease subunit